MRLKEAPNIGDRLCTTMYVFIHNELYIGCDYVQDTYQHCNLSLVRSSITATPRLLRNDLYTTGPRKWHYQVILLRSIELVIINYSIYLPKQVKIIKMIYSILFTQENRLLLSPPNYYGRVSTVVTLQSNILARFSQKRHKCHVSYGYCNAKFCVGLNFQIIHILRYISHYTKSH